jgi:hypothetical protein
MDEPVIEVTEADKRLALQCWNDPHQVDRREQYNPCPSHNFNPTIRRIEYVETDEDGPAISVMYRYSNCGYRCEMVITSSGKILFGSWGACKLCKN